MNLLKGEIAIAEKKLYRYSAHRVSNGYSEYDEYTGYTIQLYEHCYDVISETPKGYWVHHGFERRWVAKDAKNGFARDTRKQALEDFRCRTERRIGILSQQVIDAERSLILMKKREAQGG